MRLCGIHLCAVGALLSSMSFAHNPCQGALDSRLSQISSNAMYDAMAPHYREYAAKRARYIKSVDSLITDFVAVEPRFYLDIGSADGVRAMELSSKMNNPETILCDSSPQMVAKCRETSASEVWEQSISDSRILDHGRRFDVITSLWNVLGHLPDREARLNALRNMRALLNPSGRIFLDVNNRHNAAAYGWRRVLPRLIREWNAPLEELGDVSYTWEVNGTKIPATGHLFSHAEMQALCHEAQLHIIDSFVVNYETGTVSQNTTEGQLFYVLSAEAGD